MEVYQRNDVTIRMPIEEDNERIDLAGMELFFLVTNGSSCIIKKKIGEGITVIEKGLVEIEITSNDTDQPSGFYDFEFLIIDVDGKRYTIKQDKLRIRDSYAKECKDE